jgi:hypothetical protein
LGFLIPFFTPLFTAPLDESHLKYRITNCQLTNVKALTLNPEYVSSSDPSQIH